MIDVSITPEINEIDVNLTTDEINIDVIVETVSTNIDVDVDPSIYAIGGGNINIDGGYSDTIYLSSQVIDGNG